MGEHRRGGDGSSIGEALEEYRPGTVPVWAPGIGHEFDSVDHDGPQTYVSPNAHVPRITNTNDFVTIEPPR